MTKKFNEAISGRVNGIVRVEEKSYHADGKHGTTYTIQLGGNRLTFNEDNFTILQELFQDMDWSL